MVELLNTDNLRFSFPEVHPDAVLNVRLKRTVRVPDDHDIHSLPLGDISLSMEHVADHADSVLPSWKKHGGVMLGMYQSEAMCLEFNSPKNFPFAVKVGTGKRCAITGQGWVNGLMSGARLTTAGLVNLQNYVVVPPQKRLDGYKSEQGVVRQFIAVPLGNGETVEEQLTGKAEFGGIQIQVYPLTCKEVIEPEPELHEKLSVKSIQIWSNASISQPRPSMDMPIRTRNIRSNAPMNSPFPCMEKNVTSQKADDWPSSGGWWSIKRSDTPKPAKSACYLGNLSSIEKRSEQPEPIAQQPMVVSKESVAQVPLEFPCCWSDELDEDTSPVTEDEAIKKRLQNLEFGVAPGGRIKQFVLKDKYELDDWDCEHTSRVFVHLMDAHEWLRVTGKPINRKPFDNKAYEGLNLKWSEDYADEEGVVGSQLLADVKTVEKIRKVQEG